MFEPIPVGTNSPPVQIYELYNGGALPVNYELDLEPLAQLEGVGITPFISVLVLALAVLVLALALIFPVYR